MVNRVMTQISEIAYWVKGRGPTAEVMSVLANRSQTSAAGFRFAENPDRRQS